MSQSLHFPGVIPDLFGESVYLRELSERDIPGWFARATDPESADLAGDPIPDSVEAGAAWLQRHRERFRERTAIRWAIVPKESTESVGTVGLTITSQERRIAELGIVVARAHWSKGVGTSAVHLVRSFAFNALGLAEIQAEVLQRNLASVRLLEKTGFRRIERTPGGAQGDFGACFFYVLPPRRIQRVDATH
jgi:ribosomal-protein-alanine N-acetyltransferase